MAGITRSVNLLLRSSRSSLLRPRAANPVHHVLSNERYAARSFATAFERTKPHVNVGEYKKNRDLMIRRRIGD